MIKRAFAILLSVVLCTGLIGTASAEIKLDWDADGNAVIVDTDNPLPAETPQETPETPPEDTNPDSSPSYPSSSSSDDDSYSSEPVIPTGGISFPSSVS